MTPLYVAVLAVVAVCATAGHDMSEALLAAPIDCASAEADLAALEAAMPSQSERARSAFRSVTPAGVVTGAVTATHDERLHVLSGSTKEKLSVRIEEI